MALKRISVADTLYNELVLRAKYWRLHSNALLCDIEFVVYRNRNRCLYFLMTILFKTKEDNDRFTRQTLASTVKRMTVYTLHRHKEKPCFVQLLKTNGDHNTVCVFKCARFFYSFHCIAMIQRDTNLLKLKNK